jgi:hypothetical protein
MQGAGGRMAARPFVFSGIGKVTIRKVKASNADD